VIHLSPVDANRILWAMVCHTKEKSSEVELITTRFFKSKKKALKWFARKRKAEDFIEPEAVEVSHLDRLTLHSERLTIDSEDVHE
jgi:hypothetical protein